MSGLTHKLDIDLVTLPDCGGLRENGTCNWLNVPVCTGAECRYNKGRDSRNKTYERLCTLDEETQAHIANKYYGGARPWINTGKYTEET